MKFESYLWLRPHLDFDLHFAFGLAAAAVVAVFGVVDVEFVGVVGWVVVPLLSPPYQLHQH